MYKFILVLFIMFNSVWGQGMTEAQVNTILQNTENKIFNVKVGEKTYSGMIISHNDSSLIINIPNIGNKKIEYSTIDSITVDKKKSKAQNRKVLGEKALQVVVGTFLVVVYIYLKFFI